MLSVGLATGDRLAGLHAELVAALASAVGFEPERRCFRPHVTVGRVARGTRIEMPDELEPAAPRLRFRAPALTLYRSLSSPAGAGYERLAGVDLR